MSWKLLSHLHQRTSSVQVCRRYTRKLSRSTAVFNASVISDNAAHSL